MTSATDGAEARDRLTALPDEVLQLTPRRMDALGVQRLGSTCRAMQYGGAPASIGPAEAELRERLTARGVGHAMLAAGAPGRLATLARSDARGHMLREPTLATRPTHSVFVDLEGHLRTCGKYPVGQSVGDAVGQSFGGFLTHPVPPTMPGVCILSVAASDRCCLALAATGEVYSWGDNRQGGLGHGDLVDREVPTRIHGLEGIESIAAGASTRAAVGGTGVLYTWGTVLHHWSSVRGGLEYDPPAPSVASAFGMFVAQTTPRAVALANERVVGVSIGNGFTLVATDGSDVLSWGNGAGGYLGRGTRRDALLPQRIEALAETGRRFVAVATGDAQAYAIASGGELYAWGENCGRSMGNPDPLLPCRVMALEAECVKFVAASESVAFAVTELGDAYSLCPDQGLVRVPALVGFKVRAATACEHHAIFADEGGALCALTLDCVGRLLGVAIPTTRVRVHHSPQVEHSP